MQDQADRLSTQEARQKKLMTRVDELMQKLMESREPELSPAEQAWAVDVIKSEKMVKGFDERRHKVQTQYEILKRRMLELHGSLYGVNQEQDSAGGEAKGKLSNSLTGKGERGASSFGGQSTMQRRQPARRFGTAQIKTVESALSVE